VSGGHVIGSKLRDLFTWMVRGYKDAQEHTLFKRSPPGDCPEVSDDELPEEWRAYFDGIRSCAFDAYSAAARKVRRQRDGGNDDGTRREPLLERPD